MNDTKDFFLSAGANDDGNADCVIHRYGNKYLFVSAYKWLYWTGKHWSTDQAEQMLARDITTILKIRAKLAIDAAQLPIVRAAIPNASRINACKELIDERVVASVGDFDADPDLLNVDNGVLNLRTGELLPHDPKYRFTYCAPVAYDPDADMTLWTDFLRQAITPKDSDPASVQTMLDYLQMAVGYGLTGHTAEECMWYAEGPSRSGKGTFTETLIAMLGWPIAIETDFGTFTAKRDASDQGFDLAPLKPARLVFASESNAGEWLNTGRVKRMTGGNNITCSFKHKDQFTYRPQFKIWLTSNHPMRADVDDDAVWGRVKVIKFPNSHLGHEDKTLKQRMRLPENLRGVLRWAVEGAKAWFRSEDGLMTPPEIYQANDHARDEVDFVRAWIDECAEPREGTWASNSTIYQSYQSWCKANGVLPKSQRGLALSLQRKGYMTGVVKRLGDKTHKGVVGLGNFD